ncbi:MAG: TonB-dependent receptor plug domain-containing protein [Bacteroidetes bacterium SB0662_bin_6]|nr:TonB-dependent receptor plug domain-containing protein [Bacteroidetes bacterium SB0668_bin_1]MYE03744.1 TonB-dependent receptor plug domain-containing protein [Bacteroidetes bacterium SB0662_bin_6]
MKNYLPSFLLSVLLALLTTSASLAQSGKIAGRITDVAGEPIPGANVVIDGTVRGAASDADGYYVILNVSPGTYALRGSFIGFTPQTIQDVRVNIDQTTVIDFLLSEAAVGLDEVVVTADLPVVQADVSNSQLNVSSDQIEALPVSSISSVVGLQAGVQGLSVRGSGSDELAFMVNGLGLRDERNNAPFTNISLTSVQEVQVQTGGFNAEYGNVRSGVVNVITREGNPNRYEVDAIVRYSPPAQKHFGARADDLNAYWIRPFMDPDVAWLGTESGAWDEATQQQYPNFEGWVAVSDQLLRDDNPDNDLTPEALQKAFLWQHRKEMEIVTPDYNIDVGVGGPLPIVGKSLGDLRFYASFRTDQDMYLIPLHTDRFRAHTGHIKLTSNISPTMKLTVEGLQGRTTGTASSRAGQPGIFRSASSIAAQLNRVSFIDSRTFSTDYWGPTTVNTWMAGAKFTHLLSNASFYEVRFNTFGSHYDSNPGPLRDETPVVTFGGVGFDEAPFGFQPKPTFGVDGMRTGVGMSNARDSSRVITYNLQGDYTSQLNRFLQLKTGLEFNLADTRVNYGRFDAFLPSGNSHSTWEKTPVRGAAYAQSKLEFRGMIANLGLRLDYFNAGGDWITYDDPFTNAFSARFASQIDSLLAKEPTARLVKLSPRMGVSFPVTAVSKLFFNYGHFRSLPDPNNIYLIRPFTETGQISRVANPNNPLPKTIAYELGYEQAFFDQFLARLAGYYKDVSLQPYLVEYISRDGQVNYDVTEPNSYEDIRGFEVTLSRTRGRWVQGFVNYTYMVFTSGYFGLRRNFENPTAQREFEESDTERRRASSRPVPRPYGRLNIDFLSPRDFGPDLGAFYPLGGWRASFIGSWQQGSKYTWTGGGAVPGVLNNVSFRDSWNLNLRLSKQFDIRGRRAQFFVDVFNLLNRKTLSFSGFVNGNDQNAYLRSLHLPESDDYSTNIPGKDKIGAYRDYDTPFQPMQRIPERTSVTAPDPGVIYWEYDSRSWIEYRNGAWAPADQQKVDDALDSKAYIDMPNQNYLTFLNPRDFYWGIRITL